MSGSDIVKKHFQMLDFVVFFGFLTLSLGVGIFFGYRDRRKHSTENYFFADRQLSPVAVAISIAVSYVSAITIIGVPADVYLHGSTFAMHTLSLLIVDVIAIVYYIPLFHKLKMLSVFEYLELRYHRSVRMMVSGLQITCTILYMSIATFLPALALHTVTPLDLRWTIALTSITCIVYTALGGIKAVVWTDVIQSIVMIGGLIATFGSVVGTLGGFEAVTEAVERGKRNTVFKSDIDPRVKNTVWSITFGTSIVVYNSFICNQSFVQRWLACKTVRKARLAVGIGYIPLAILIIFSVLVGMAVYANYEGCDPLMLKELKRADQIVPYMVLNIFRDVPGMAGLFVSAAFCGTLSTVSSGINAIAANALSDFVGVWFPNIVKNHGIWISRALTAIFGILVMVTAYVTSISSTNAVGIVMAIQGLFASSIVAIFIMGPFMPWINFKAAIVGGCAGFLLVTWIAISSMILPIDDSRWQPLPLSIENCTDFLNSSKLSTRHMYFETKNATARPTQEISDLGRTLFAISPYLYGLLGTVTCIIISHVSSIFTGFQEPSDDIRRLAVPVVRWRSVYPPCLRKYFFFGNESEKKQDSEENKKLRALSSTTYVRE